MDAVRRLSTNEAYRGVLRFGENSNPSAHEAVVPEHLWDAAQDAFWVEEKAAAKVASPDLPDRSHGYQKADRTDTYPYYLRGHVFRESCGCRMTPAGHKGMTTTVPYYECITGGNRSKAKASVCCCPRINAGRLHEAVLSEIDRAARHPTRLDLLIREAVKRLPSGEGLREELARLYRNRREAEKKIARLVGAITVGGGVGGETLAREIGTQEAHRDALTEAAKAIEARFFGRRHSDLMQTRYGSYGVRSGRTGTI